MWFNVFEILSQGYLYIDSRGNPGFKHVTAMLNVITAMVNAEVVASCQLRNQQQQHHVDTTTTACRKQQKWGWRSSTNYNF